MHVDNLNAVQPPNVPNEEKDYVFLKRLEAIYIDDDISVKN